MIEPPTIASAHAQGEVTVRIDCPACHRHAVIATDDMPGHWYVVDIPIHMRLICSACGCRDIQIMKDMHAHYERDRAMRGFPPDPSPSYRVIRLPMPGNAETER